VRKEFLKKFFAKIFIGQFFNLRKSCRAVCREKFFARWVRPTKKIAVQKNAAMNFI